MTCSSVNRLPFRGTGRIVTDRTAFDLARFGKMGRMIEAEAVRR
jgi:hypothetical protein